MKLNNTGTVFYSFTLTKSPPTILLELSVSIDKYFYTTPASFTRAEQFIKFECLIGVNTVLFTPVHKLHRALSHSLIFQTIARSHKNNADKSKLARVVRHVEIDNASHPFPISHTAHTPSAPILAPIIFNTHNLCLGLL